MRGELCVTVDVSCYNDQLAVWEPVVEPVMKQEDNYKPWELVVKVTVTQCLLMMAIYVLNPLHVGSHIRTPMFPVHYQLCHLLQFHPSVFISPSTDLLHGSFGLGNLHTVKK